MNVNIHLPQAATPSKRQKTSTSQSQQLIMPGQVITAEAGYLRGHGTYDNDGKLIASVGGTVERVNKLVSARYHGEVGDVVVGRIASVSQRSWKVDLNARQDAMLLLSAINLPTGELRKRTASDELQMRSFFAENDVIVAEVQQVKSDGILALHTRSQKYGKLINGQLIQIPASLIKRVKNHFYSFGFGVDVILGNNGLIWITEPTKEYMETDNPQNPAEVEREIKIIQYDLRERISRVRNSIAVLSELFTMVYPESIQRTYFYSTEQKIAAKDMLSPEFMENLKNFLKKEENS